MERDLSSSKQSVILVCGLSGAGRSTTLKVLEDCGYHPIDNFPPKLLPRLFTEPLGQDKIALGFTVLSAEEINLLVKFVNVLKQTTKIELVFLKARSSVLVRRFSETRRLHPLTTGRPLQETIDSERVLLEPLREAADIVIDTSSLSPHQLKAQIKQRLNLEGEHPFQVQVMSFSYKRGVPVDADFVWDCRFLKNPHWDRALRQSDGRDQSVVDFIETDPDFFTYWNDIERMLGYTIPRIHDEGRSYVTIAFGCSGGRHRSVAFAEKTYKTLTRSGFMVTLYHRELE